MPTAAAGRPARTRPELGAKALPCGSAEPLEPRARGRGFPSGGSPGRPRALLPFVRGRGRDAAQAQCPSRRPRRPSPRPRGGDSANGGVGAAPAALNDGRDGRAPPNVSRNVGHWSMCPPRDWMTGLAYLLQRCCIRAWTRLRLPELLGDTETRRACRGGGPEPEPERAARSAAGVLNGGAPPATQRRGSRPLLRERGEQPAGLDDSSDDRPSPG